MVPPSPAYNHTLEATMADRLSLTNITCTKTSNLVFVPGFPPLGNIKASFDPRCSNICDVTQLRTAECAYSVIHTRSHTHTDKEREREGKESHPPIVIIAMSAIPSIFSAFAFRFVLSASSFGEGFRPGEFPLVCANSWGFRQSESRSWLFFKDLARSRLAATITSGTCQRTQKLIIYNRHYLYV